MSGKKRELVYAPTKLRVPWLGSGCPGCGHTLAGKVIMEVIEELGIDGKVVAVGGIGCHGLALMMTIVDRTIGAHGTAPATATGIKQALFDDAIVFTFQGDGDCAAIGAGYLVNAAARAEKITVFMVNNANYGTTGGQMAPTTLLGQVTPTTPMGRDARMFGYPLHVPEMLASIKGVAYSARSAVNNPANFQRTKRYAKVAFQKQIDDVGFSFVEILDPCPVNWHMDPVDAMKWIEEKQIAEYPLGEFKNVDRID